MIGKKHAYKNETDISIKKNDNEPAGVKHYLDHFMLYIYIISILVISEELQEIQLSTFYENLNDENYVTVESCAKNNKKITYKCENNICYSIAFQLSDKLQIT